MSLVIARVEEELKAPLQNILGGDLMQLLLIQTQVMKVDMEHALIQMDAVMRANRLNFALMACFPASLLAFASYKFSRTLGASRAFHSRRKAREEMRLLIADAERSLIRLKMTRDDRHKKLGKKSSDISEILYRLETSETNINNDGEDDDEDDDENLPFSLDETLESETFYQGMLLCSVNSLYACIQKHKTMFTPRELRGIKLDAMALADVRVSIDGKLATTARLARIYKGFQAEPHRVPSIVHGRYPM